MVYNKVSFRGYGDHGEVKGDGMDAIEKKIEMLENVGLELDFELERLFTRLEELNLRRDVIASQIALFGIRRAGVAFQLDELEGRLQNKESLFDEIEQELNSAADREALREAHERAYVRYNHYCSQWEREAKMRRRGCDVSKKKHRKQVRDACRKAAREEREALEDIFSSFLAENE